MEDKEQNFKNNNYLNLELKNEKLVLPSEKNNNLKPKKLKSKKKLKLKWWFIITFLIIIYLFYNQIIFYFLEILKTNPTIYSYYLYIETEISNNSLKGLFFASILGSLFFLVIPSEALFIYYLSTTNFLFIKLIIIMIIGNLIGLIFNYLFGRLMGKRILKFIFGEEKYLAYQDKINNYGGYFILVGNIFPGPIEFVAVFFGAFRFNFIRYVYLSFFGRLIKYILLFLIFHYFWDYLTNYYDYFINNFSILKDLFTKDFFNK